MNVCDRALINNIYVVIWLKMIRFKSLARYS